MFRRKPAERRHDEADAGARAVSWYSRAPLRAHAMAAARTREERLAAARGLVQLGWAVADIARLAQLEEREVRRALRRVQEQ